MIIGSVAFKKARVLNDKTRGRYQKTRHRGEKGGVTVASTYVGRCGGLLWVGEMQGFEPKLPRNLPEMLNFTRGGALYIFRVLARGDNTILSTHLVCI